MKKWLEVVYKDWGVWAALAVAAFILLAWWLGFDLAEAVGW